MSTAPVDHDRTAVGEAEERAFGGTDAEEQRSLAALIGRADAVMTGGWWADVGAPSVPIVAARRSARSSRARWCAGAPVPTIALAAGQRDLATLAHELAHVVAGLRHGHDAVFRAAAVDVAIVVIGPSGGAALRAAFAEFGLLVASRRWPPPWRLAGPGFRVGFDVANA